MALLDVGCCGLIGEHGIGEGRGKWVGQLLSLL